MISPIRSRPSIQCYPHNQRWANSSRQNGQPVAENFSDFVGCRFRGMGASLRHWIALLLYRSRLLLPPGLMIICVSNGPRQWLLNSKALGIHMNPAPNADNEVFANNYLFYFGADEKPLPRKQRRLSITRNTKVWLIYVAKHLPRKPVTNAQDIVTRAQMSRQHRHNRFCSLPAPHSTRWGIIHLQSSFFQFALEKVSCRQLYLPSFQKYQKKD